MYTMTGREVFGRSGLPVGLSRLSLDRPYDDHMHDFVEVVIVLDGTGIHRTAAGEHPLRRGAVVALRPGAWHGYEPGATLELINLYLQPAVLHRELNWVLEVPDLAVALMGSGVSSGALDDGALGRVVTLLSFWTGSLERRPTAVALAVITALLNELVGARFSPSAPGAGGLSMLVRDGILLMAEASAHPWTVAELSTRLGMSASALQHRFRQDTGIPPMAWLARFRAEETATLLARTDLPVGEIGRRVGWGDPNYLARRFRAFYAMSPREYRRRFRMADPVE